jgi:hypothetical protein
VLFPGFYVEGVRFGRAVVDDFGFNGTAFEPPTLTAVRSNSAIILSWIFPGTNFGVIASTSPRKRAVGLL